MNAPRPVSLVAERAVRYLRGRGEPVSSRLMARELLATEAADEGVATAILRTAFGDDPRLAYDGDGWSLKEAPVVNVATRTEPAPPDPDRTLVFLRGDKPSPGHPFQLTGISVIRLNGDEVLTACGGDATGGRGGNRLRRAVREALDGAVPVLHEPDRAIRAFESWLGEPLDYPVLLRRLARERSGLPPRHQLADLAARLGLVHREAEDPLEQADTLDACMNGVRRPGESLQELRAASADRGTPLDWSRFAFNREFLRQVPRVPGTYEFFDAEGRLLYVGQSRCLHDRLASYFSDSGRRSARVRRLLENLHDIRYHHSGSALEAALREAEMIACLEPSENVQRNVSARQGRGARLRSILILEPAEAPAILRAFLIRDGRLIDKVQIGPRGGGLRRIRRLLDDRFFSCPTGPTPATDGPDLDVELIVRWLGDNRERVVAFDPTDLRSSDEVVERLRWFLGQGSPFDPDGAPIVTR